MAGGAFFDAFDPTQDSGSQEYPKKWNEKKISPELVQIDYVLISRLADFRTVHMQTKNVFLVYIFRPRARLVPRTGAGRSHQNGAAGPIFRFEGVYPANA